MQNRGDNVTSAMIASVSRAGSSMLPMRTSSQTISHNSAEWVSCRARLLQYQRKAREAQGMQRAAWSADAHQTRVAKNYRLPPMVLPQLLHDFCVPFGPLCDELFYAPFGWRGDWIPIAR